MSKKKPDPVQEAARNAYLESLTFEQIAQGIREFRVREEDSENNAKRARKGKALLEDEARRRMVLAEVETQRVEGGNFHFRERQWVNIADKEEFYAFLQTKLETEGAEAAFGVFTSGIRQEFVKSYQEEHEGVPPPGISVYPELQIIFANTGDKNNG